MDQMTKEACRLLFACMGELMLHDEQPNHETNPELKKRLQEFMVKYDLDNPKKVADKLCD